MDFGCQLHRDIDFAGYLRNMWGMGYPTGTTTKNTDVNYEVSFKVYDNQAELVGTILCRATAFHYNYYSPLLF